MSTRRQMGAMLLASLSLVSCNNLLHQTPAPPDAYQASSALAPVVSKSSASFTAQNRQQARAYCLSHLNSLSSSFTLKFDYGNVNTEMNAVVQDMLNSGVATAMQMESLGNRVTFIPEYSDCVVMLRAHRQPARFLGGPRGPHHAGRPDPPKCQMRSNADRIMRMFVQILICRRVFPRNNAH